jgi:hypothetical protein
LRQPSGQNANEEAQSEPAGIADAESFAKGEWESGRRWGETAARRRLDRYQRDRASNDVGINRALPALLSALR